MAQQYDSYPFNIARRTGNSLTAVYFLLETLERDGSLQYWATEAPREPLLLMTTIALAELAERRRRAEVVAAQ